MENNPYISKKYKILEVIPETDIDYTYRIEFDKSLIPGQFLQVSIPKVGECPISVSDFGNGYMDMTIRHVGNVTNQIKELKKGDWIFLRGPYGNGFDLENFKGKHLIVSAGGTGLAPVKKIISYFYKNPLEVKKMNVLVGFKTPRDILFKNEVDQWIRRENINTILTVDRNDESWACNTGFITDFVSHVKIDDLSSVEVVIVGPPLMMSCTAREFLKLNVKEENIWVSFERNMSCGIGKCGHCKIDETYVCLEGPVFRYSTAKKLLD